MHTYLYYFRLFVYVRPGNLVIANVRVSDEGTYVCRADNGNERSQASVAFVRVQRTHFPPLLTYYIRFTYFKRNQGIHFAVIRSKVKIIRPRVSTDTPGDAKCVIEILRGGSKIKEVKGSNKTFPV